MSATPDKMIRIGSHEVGSGATCFVIAEVAQAHDGSLGTAHAYIDAVAKTGAQAIKFQTHIAEAESTPAEQFRVRFSSQDKTRYDYWKRMEFTAEQWAGLAKHSGERGLVFLSSPFSIPAVDLLERIGMLAWKVGSGEVSNWPMIERMARTGKPVLLSSGLSDWAALDSAVGWVRAAGVDLAVFQCRTAYPCPPEEIGLNVMAELRERYGSPVGLSDHSGTVYAGLAAAALGANLLEVHVVFSRECFGPDVAASLTMAELAELVKGVRFIERATAHPVDKDRAASEVGELRQMFGKSVVAAKTLPAGHRMSDGDLAFKKPGSGIPAAEVDRVVGRVLKRAVEADRLLAEQDFE